MEGCGSNKYTQSEFSALFASILDGTYSDYINSWFDPTTANTLLRGISLDPANPNAGLKNIDDILDFLYSLDPEEEVNPETREGNNPKYSTEYDTVDLTPRADFTESGGTVVEYDETIGEFKTQIVERTLLKDGQLIDPDTVSENLFNYRLELLQKLYNFVAPGKELPELTSPESFTRFTNTLLSLVLEKKKQKPKEFKNYRSNYIILKNFDHLLEDEIDYITVKSEYRKSNLLWKDMYESTGPFNYKDRFASFSETAGTEDYTSSFVKLLLWYFKVDGRPIGLDGFQAISGEILEMVETPDEGQINQLMQRALYEGVEDSLTNEYGVKYLFESFIKNPAVKPTSKKIAQAIYDNIFSTKSPLDNKIKKIFLNQFITSVRYAYLAYRLKYDSDIKEMRFVSELLQSELINKQTYNVQRAIKARVYALTHNPEMLQELLDKYDIEITRNSVSINTSGNSKVNLYRNADYANEAYVFNVLLDEEESTTYSISSKSRNVHSKLLSKDFIKEFIEDVTGLSLPDDFTDVYTISNPNGNMWDDLARMAIIVLTATAKADDGSKLYDRYQFLYRNEELKLSGYFKAFEPLGNFFSVVYGTDYNTVIKNAEGNNLPTSQLRTSVFDVKREIYSIHNRAFKQRSSLRPNTVNENGEVVPTNPTWGQHVFGRNYLYQHPEIIGTTAMRSDTKLDNQSRVAQQLLPAEVLHEAIDVDFYASLTSTSKNEGNALHKTRYNQGKRRATDVSIWIQPIVYSDKRTHFVIEFRVNKLLIKGEKFSDLLKTVATFEKGRTKAIEKIENELRAIRLDKYEKQAISLISRFSTALKWNLKRNESESIRDYFDRAKAHLHEFYLVHGKNTAAELEKHFGTEADIFNQADISVADSGEVFFNPTLDNQISTYSDKIRFDTRIKANKINFVRTLIDAGYSLDPAYNPNWKSTFKKLQTEENAEWFDDFDGSMKLFIAKDAEGNVIEIDWTNMNDIDWNSVDFQLNPILESYYYADVFLSSQYTDILFGDVNGYNAKHKTYKLKDGTSLLNEMFLIEDESARLADMAKRTVNAGASRITFTQGLKYGIDSKALIANVRDLLGPAFNFTGVIDDKFKTQDGSTYCHPVFARLQNFSLLDRRVGNQRKKTFGNGIDPETGIAWELKHAEYTLTNEYRRIGCEHTDYSYELMYKKTSSLKSDKFGKVDISKYYGKEVHKNSDGENVTCITDIYRWNQNTLLYEKLESVEQNGPNVIAHWQPYNDDHSKIEGAEYTEDFYLDDLYALDQLFGGAYCAVWNNNANRFEFSEINQDLLAVIVCEEGLKTNFISLVSNESATKVGVRNLNNSDIFRRGNNASLKYWEFSTLCYGIQMNPDHDIEDEHGVREMSQMISALIQGGMLSGKVNEIYRMIGEVALDSVRTTIDAVEEGDQDTIYEIVGNALVKAFDTNQKDVLGLAQSFVSIANRDLANRSFNTRIPFSANTIKGSFQATITSFLNKDAIRRRYSGMGGINTPSNGGIQYFQWNGANLNWVEFLKTVGGKINADNLLTNLRWNGTQFDNPTIVPIDRSDIKFGDTIVYRNEFGVPVVKKIDSPSVLYDYKYHTNYGQLYNWTVKPKDLSSSNIEFIVGGKTFSIWDTDLVRIVNESMEITKHPEYFYTIQLVTDENKNTYEDIVLTDRGIQFYNLLRNAFPERNITIQDITNVDNISDYFAQAKWDISNKLLPSLSKASTEPTSIPIQESMKMPVHSIEEWNEDWIQNWQNSENRQIIIDSVTFQALQVGIGKRNSKKLGLQPGTTLNDVRSQKDKYFKKQLRKLALRPATVDPELYDAVLYSKDGTPTLVIVGSLEENAARFSRLHDNPNYKELDKHYWKNGVDYGESTNKVFKTYIDDNGKQFDVVVISSWKDFNDLYHNGLYANAVYNYTTENWDSIVKFRFKNNFDRQGFLIKNLFDINGRPAIEQTPEGDLYSVGDEDMLILELNNNESRRQTNFINRRARQMYEAFEMQLKVIVDRIPSQSMQSFLSADVAMLFDTEENLMVMSYFLLWLQGADLDVDKSFTITYEVGDDGRIVTPSKLDRYYSAEKIFDLPLPSKKKFIFYNDTDYAAKVLTGEIENDAVRIDGTNLTRQIPIELLNIILMGSGKVVFNDNVDPEIRNRIEELIQLHQSSVNLPSTQKVVGYKNKIVHIIHQVLRDPIVQAQTNVPVDEAMDELKSAIPTPSYKVEFFRTWDNPAAKFAIQRDNMVGRDVIGISAVSLKAFFAESAYGNSVITDILNLVQAYNNEFRITGKYNINIGNQIVNLLKKICFDAKFTKDPNVPTGIATIANLRFIELLNMVVPIVSTIRYTTSLTTPRLTALNNYRVIEDGVNALNLAALVSDLNIYANGTYKNPKNAALVLSGYTSLATDNAKELQLVKMNATSKFADIHTYLTSIGVPPKQIIEFMASPAFNLIARFSETSILDPNTRRFSVKNALAFVQDQSCLPVMRDDMFRTVLACEIKNKSFLDLLSTDQLFIIAEQIDPNVKRVYPDRTEIKSVVTSALKDSNLRKKAVDAIYSLLRRDPSAEKLLLKAIQGGIKNSTSRNRVETVDEDIILENQYSEEDFIDESDLENDSYYDQNEFFVNWELKKEDWIEAYRYVKNYLIPKNRALRKLTGDYSAQYARLSMILDAIEEQQILGALCGINQGLDTNDFDEYKRIRRIEKYINKKYREYVTANEGAKMDRFNFITFLNDPEERRRQIEQYEKVATTYNILDIITSIPHYNAMSRLIATNRYLIQRSVALKMERDLAEAVITADKPNEGGFNYGDTQQLTEKEWSILRNYVNDLLILKWFENQPNLTIAIPTDKYFYSNGKEQINSIKDLNGNAQPVISYIHLNTLDGLASFKRLMDTSIIPELKRAFPDNVFLKDLIVGSTHNKMLDRLQTFYCPSFDLTEVDKNGSLRSKYEAISRAFNEIAKQQLPKELSKYNTKDVTWNIGDLFFLYNLLVHKDSFASRSFTKLFEDSNVLNDFIGRQYYKYLSELDSRKINYQELFKDELFPNMEARTKAQANNYLIDLRVRLAESENSDYKFKVTSVGIGSDYQIQILNSDGEPRDLKFWDPDVNPSDYTLWFPYKLSRNVNRVKPAVDERIAIKSTVLENTTFEGVSPLVISALVKRLQEMLGRNIKIKFITTDELNDMWTTGQGEIKFVNEEDYLRTRDANAFVYNGNIYINDKNLSIDKPVHEFLHIITAAMKYSGDKSIKQMYYNLLNAVASDPENQQHYANLRAIYSGRRDSDVKEELLVEVLANRFAAQFAEGWENERTQTTEVLKQGHVIEYTINTLNTLFGSTIPEDIEAVTLGNTDLRTLLSIFGSTIINVDKPSLANTILPTDVRVRTIKQALINKEGDNNITFNRDCI